ncbi:hypothetical protein DYB34_008324 [Aphanomyces astaci]|uniref:Reverse transcriptase domain-containing protein n=1 Tax=Aphanomyces astaci TaxID=112090 RepID=A0A418BPT1_APHAT|nr:hypothetical protein DYB34_008324 [Aphanomyces astaci]
MGDVASAYRHLSASCSDASWLGLTVPEAGVIGIDMSAPFGWCGSPNVYCAFGNGISWLVAHESPATIHPTSAADKRTFWGFNYIDDHVLIEHDTADRLDCADIALRLAMMATFGPDSLNLNKFTQWSTDLHALGLNWDLSLGIVSMPQDKISKAMSRVDSMLAQIKTSRYELEKVLGSLRHVCSCIRPARAFYQNLHTLLRRLPRFGTHVLPVAALDDLRWFATILRVGRLAGVPTSIFAKIFTPQFILEMDASDEGLANLFPARCLFIQLNWDASELSLIEQCNVKTGANIPANHTPSSVNRANQSLFSINVREHICVALAIAVWGPILADPTGRRTIHVQALSDNTSALAWSSSLASAIAYAQALNRSLGLHQAQHNLHVTSAHIPGALNTHPDAALQTSRALQNDLVNAHSPLVPIANTPVSSLRIHAITALHGAALAPSSASRYTQVWGEWEHHQHSIGQSKWLTKATASAALFGYAQSLWSTEARRPNATSTIRSKIAVISWYHRCALGFAVQLNTEHAIQLRGMDRTRPVRHAKDPVSIALLQTIRGRLHLSASHDKDI